MNLVADNFVQAAHPWPSCRINRNSAMSFDIPWSSRGLVSCEESVLAEAVVGNLRLDNLAFVPASHQANH
jgi:hypothetical protein